MPPRPDLQAQFLAAELTELSGDVKEMRLKLTELGTDVAVIKNNTQDLPQLRSDVITLKTKAGIWGGVVGAFVAAVISAIVAGLSGSFKPH